MKSLLSLICLCVLLAGCSGQSVVRSMVPAQAKRPPFVKTDDFLKVSNLYGPDVHITLGVTIALMAYSMPKATNWGEPVLIITTRRAISEGYGNWNLLSDSDGNLLTMARVSQQPNPGAIARDATRGALDEAMSANTPRQYLESRAGADWRLKLYGSAGAAEEFTIPAVYVQNFLRAYDETPVPRQ